MHSQYSKVLVDVSARYGKRWEGRIISYYDDTCVGWWVVEGCGYDKRAACPSTHKHSLHFLGFGGYTTIYIYKGIHRKKSFVVPYIQLSITVKETEKVRLFGGWVVFDCIAALRLCFVGELGACIVLMRGEQKTTKNINTQNDVVGCSRGGVKKTK